LRTGEGFFRPWKKRPRLRRGPVKKGKNTRNEYAIQGENRRWSDERSEIERETYH